MAQDTWRPDQYARFRAERLKPFEDLLALVQPIPGGRAIDLGCGTGDSTRLLHERLQARETLGVDSSASMLERASSVAGGGLRFEQRDIADLQPDGSWDVVFSNAALHWVPEHRALFDRLSRSLRPGGQLAVQMPANFGHPSHRVAAAVAAEAPFRAALGGWERDQPVLAPEAYATLLHALGFQEQQVRLQIYGHVLAAPEDVIEWVKGTLLTDYESHLGPLFPRFLQRYREVLLPLLGDERPYFYTYPRVLLWARR
jgi:trans-aconitate 2-methyltransferase